MTIQKYMNTNYLINKIICRIISRYEVFWTSKISCTLLIYLIRIFEYKWFQRPHAHWDWFCVVIIILLGRWCWTILPTHFPLSHPTVSPRHCADLSFLVRSLQNFTITKKLQSKRHPLFVESWISAADSWADNIEPRCCPILVSIGNIVWRLTYPLIDRSGQRTKPGRKVTTS